MKNKCSCTQDPRDMACDVCLGLLAEEDNENKDSARVPDNCQCHCEELGCEWKGIIGDCETTMDSDGWEYPEHEVLVCPKCGEYSIMF